MQPFVDSPLPLRWFRPVMWLVVCLAGSGLVGQAAELRREAQADGVEYSVDLSNDRVQLSETLQLTLSIRKPIEIDIERPDAAPGLTQFFIRDLAQPLPKLAGQVEQIQLIYTLEPKQIGPARLIPPGLVYWLPGLDHTDENARLIEVDPLQLEIVSQLVSEQVSLDQLKPPPGPMEPTSQNATWLWATGAGVLVFGSAVGWWLWRSRARRNSPTESPREQARRQLRQLVDSKLAHENQKLFFVELTGIVRRYIESSTGVRAPELTTEEFLQAIGQESTFSDQQRESLRAFLESADLIKFAGAHAGSKDIDDAVQRAEHFVSMEHTPPPIENTSTVLSERMVAS